MLIQVYAHSIYETMEFIIKEAVAIIFLQRNLRTGLKNMIETHCLIQCCAQLQSNSSETTATIKFLAVTKPALCQESSLIKVERMPLLSPSTPSCEMANIDLGG